jgi:hypothetical protein
MRERNELAWGWVKGNMFRCIREEQKRGKIIIIALTEIYQSAFL